MNSAVQTGVEIEINPGNNSGHKNTGLRLEKCGPENPAQPGWGICNRFHQAFAIDFRTDDDIPTDGWDKAQRYLGWHKE